jgi:hypothetical protein
MNERILELAVQAEKLADEATNAYNDDTGNWRKVWNEVYDEKFAELIVRECIKAASDPSDRWIVGDTWYDGVRSCVWSIQDQFNLDRNFGIEP